MHLCLTFLHVHCTLCNALAHLSDTHLFVRWMGCSLHWVTQSGYLRPLDVLFINATRTSFTLTQLTQLNYVVSKDDYNHNQKGTAWVPVDWQSNPHCCGEDYLRITPPPKPTFCLSECSNPNKWRAKEPLRWTSRCTTPTSTCSVWANLSLSFHPLEG